MAAAACLTAAAPAWGADGGCPAYADAAVAVGRVAPVLPELSGLAASRRHAGIYWAHNDSGNAFVLYAMRENGAVVASFPVHGGPAVDVEDVGTGPCGLDDPRPCIYLADTGDNLHTRAGGQIFRVLEPEILRPRTLVAERLPFVYPDGSRDVEAVLVDPRTAEIFLVTKSLLGLGDLYRIDPAPGGRHAVHVAALPSGDAFDVATTAASVHPSGERALVRTYRFAWEFRRPGAASVAELLATPPARVPTAFDGLPEAITYTTDGRGYLLAGEGEGTAIRRVVCREPAPPTTRH